MRADDSDTNKLLVSCEALTSWCLGDRLCALWGRSCSSSVNVHSTSFQGVKITNDKPTNIYISLAKNRLRESVVVRKCCVLRVSPTLTKRFRGVVIHLTPSYM